MVDALHVVMDANRIPYTRVIVNRRAFKDKVINASEHFEDGLNSMFGFRAHALGHELREAEHPARAGRGPP